MKSLTRKCKRVKGEVSHQTNSHPECYLLLILYSIKYCLQVYSGIRPRKETKKIKSKSFAHNPFLPQLTIIDGANPIILLPTSVAK